MEIVVENCVQSNRIYMKFFKNKFFIAALSIAVFVAILSATLTAMGVTDPLKDLLNSVSVPVRYVGVAIKDSIDGFGKYFTAIDKLDAENDELKAEIDRLEGLLADSNAVREENERLKDYIGIKKLYPDFKLTEALIIGSESDNYMTVLTLNKGRDHGIDVGMAVMVSDGVVGSVCEVGSNWCRVKALPESSSSVGAYLPRCGEIGVVSGDISLKDTGECYLKYLSADADVRVDDEVYTSGIGSVYPEGLLIGRISEITVNDNLRTKEARVTLSVDFQSLKYVLIITDFGVTGVEKSAD